MIERLRSIISDVPYTMYNASVMAFMRESILGAGNQLLLTAIKSFLPNGPGSLNRRRQNTIQIKMKHPRPTSKLVEVPQSLFIAAIQPLNGDRPRADDPEIMILASFSDSRPDQPRV